MCGIVGYVGSRPAQELLLAGLRKLEYRGYDSAGISVIDGDPAKPTIDSVRAVGNLDKLEAALQDDARRNGDQPAATGIAHTRWATHGRVNEVNAHPHSDNHDRVHVVVNGIVENYLALKHRLIDDGAQFTSETDAEVVAHLVSHHFDGDLREAVRRTFNDLEGHYAFVAMCVDDPDTLVGARQECPLVIGRGEGETFLASAVPAFLASTRNVQALENGEIVEITTAGATIYGADGVERAREVTAIDWDEETAEKGGYDTFMLKEIHDQPDAVADTVADRTVRPDGVDLDDVGALDEELLKNVDRIVIVACGTSFNAGLIGRYAIEEWARVPVDMDIASEFRYRNPIFRERDLVIGITQSGETADTLAAMRVAKEAGAKVLAITNMRDSQATRDAHGVLFTRAGLEVSVAATKTFVCQVAVLYLLALRLAELRGELSTERLTELVAQVKHLPHLIDELLQTVDVEAVAEQHKDDDFFLYLGRHAGRAVALEGALKLKEVAYIATDAYAAGEMKHGPIALLDEKTPVVCVATDSPILDKMISNMQEVRARGAHVIAIATEGNTDIAAHSETVIYVPQTDWIVQPLLAVIPLQLLAYEIARKRGLNVDQPRNLAKTVTVE